MLHMGFTSALQCVPEAPTSSFNLEASIEAKEVNEIYLKAERDNGTLAKTKDGPLMTGRY